MYIFTLKNDFFPYKGHTNYFGEGNLEYITVNDEIKNQYCLYNNIKLIRIPYWEFDVIKNILIF